ncbi:katanin p80 WD40 repeat-containing subunit B1 isoform X1 [Lingula anatina]|uniref:Katanin p80 WD40 repeat-containing subunit B1 n=1 Tax=Lingula anatina TaxID=7574 RepID=A0A1S3HNG1_LINAN|nr:katanin p80 WD40 repeat-containing subunit B1 isoform X1 [Lingula anatina]|eukprot:XP_013387061.1 katanin p80 WD40 repeat-containing subunit B1 isoform X1 [Lingula anatina]
MGELVVRDLRCSHLEEFVAHGSNVNCLALGHKSGRVMVTGGEDKKVNMWAVGKPNCIMSLSGHTSAIEAVRFGNSEEMVAAGSMSGALKIWDLEAAKIVRTLTGHKANLRSLDFHPYGDFVASGSLDTNIKLWDIKRKGCIFTYKGHTNCVNCLRFSPDGRWIASAGEDGSVKLWDLTAGKLLTELNDHTGPVNSLEFHPNEFLLASGSSDRTAKYWDLETFQCVSTTDGECGGIRSISFHPDGLCLYAATQDVLKVYGWEPARCYDTVATGWGKVVDIATAQSQLIGALYSQTNVSTYVVDLQKVQPMGGVPAEPSPEPPTVQAAPAAPPAQRLSASGRKSFQTDRPQTQSTKQQNPYKEEPQEPAGQGDDPEDDAQSVADIKDPNDYREIFQPRHGLSHSPTTTAQPFPAPPDDGIPEKDIPPPPVIVKHNTRQQPVHVPPQRAAQSSPSQQTQSRQQQQPAQPAQFAPPPVSQQPHSQPPAPHSATSVPASTVIPSQREQPVGLAVEDFLPKRGVPVVNEGQSYPSNMSEAEAISTIMKGHDAMVAVMSSRTKNLSIVRALWTGGNMKTALDSAVNMNDQAVIVDLLNVLIFKPALWNLDVCLGMLPHLKDLINSKYESYVHCGCSALKLVLKNFGPVIKETVNAPPSIGVDITREERIRKCKSCFNNLMDIRSTLDSKSHVQGKMGSTFREVQLLMSLLE